MPTRAETTATTRRELLDAATELLDAGGPAAVTLRDVGARARVSRSAPYRHFADKASLLSGVAAEGWQRLAKQQQADPGADPQQALHHALISYLQLARGRPHLYRLMFATPGGDLRALTEAVDHAKATFRAVVAGVVGDEQAPAFSGLLLAAAHGIADLTLSGHLTAEKWNTTPDELIDRLIAMLPYDADVGTSTFVSASGPPKV